MDTGRTIYHEPQFLVLRTVLLLFVEYTAATFCFGCMLGLAVGLVGTDVECFCWE